MNTHLSAQEFVDALEEMLPADRRQHLATCESCEREVAELRALTGAARGADRLIEPSPLFWDHFSRRVREATAHEAIVPPRWWDAAWRPVMAVAAVAAAVMLVVVLGRQGSGSGPGSAAVMSDRASAAGELAIDQDSMNLVAQIVSDLPDEELRQAPRPTMDATAAVIDELTPAQRAEFIRLINAEIGEQ